MPLKQAAPAPESGGVAFSRGGDVLRSVSRSFYLSIRLLPENMRDRVALAYLLARMSDTVADTAKAPLTDRKRVLVQIRGLTSMPVWTPGDTGLLAEEMRETILPHVSHEGERRLLEVAGDVLDWWKVLSPHSRAPLDQVLDQITHGQLLDLDRFGGASGLTFVETSEDLVQYTDLVAGSVGRFWTALAHEADPEFASLPLERMTSLGTNYGRGLQMLNIIRDLHEDLPHGRCYLPLEELHREGWEAGTAWNRNCEPLRRVAERWMIACESNLRDGLIYTRALRPGRLRMATLLPATIGLETLKQLRRPDADYLSGKVRVSRNRVKWLMLSGTVAAFLPRRR